MRSNVEWKRCACGNLIGLRESCARCADKRRAELHAAGVAGSEQDEQRRRETRELWAKLDFAGEILKMPSFGAELDGTPPYQRLEQLASEAAEQAHRMTGRVPYAVVTPQPEGDTVYWVLDGKAHQCHWVSGAERSVVMDGATSLRWQVVGGRVSVESVNAEHDRARAALKRPEPSPRFNQAEFDRLKAVAERCAHPKLQPRGQAKVDGECPDCEGMVVWFRDGDPFTIDKSSRLSRRPAVGAEVDYATALADMTRRQEARYSRANGSSRDVYRCRDDKLEFYYGYASAWKVSGLDAKTLATGVWRRLADATDNEPPAIGDEVSWEVAKADMMRRREARYRPASHFGSEYRIQDDGGLYFKLGGGREWNLSRKEADGESGLWERLA